MKRFSPATSTLVLTAALTLTVSAETVQEIMEGIESEKVEALTAYLEANPEAADRDAAIAHLIAAHEFLGDEEQITGLLEQRYAVMDKGADANLGELMGKVVQPLVTSYTEAGEKAKAKEFLARVREDTKDHRMAGQIGQFLDQLGGGLNAPGAGDTLEIAFTDINGTEIDLAAMKGKVVLVDFWATWCGPCVAEMPNVIAAYEKFHDKGFEVIGISLDSDKEKLLSFIKRENMPWPQYFDGKGWENELAGKFGIRGIPATFLVGKDGKVAASDLRGPALEAKLSELLGE